MKKNDHEKKEFLKQIDDLKVNQKDLQILIAEKNNAIELIKKKDNKGLLKQYALLKQENVDLQSKLSKEELNKHIVKYKLKSDQLNSGERTSQTDVSENIGQVRPAITGDGPVLQNSFQIIDMTGNGNPSSFNVPENELRNQGYNQGQRVINYQQLGSNDYNPKAEATCFIPFEQPQETYDHDWNSYYFPPNDSDIYYEEY